MEGGQISYHGSLMSSEPWWYRCIALSDDPSRFGKFCEFRVLVKLAESRSVIYCKRSRSWCDWHLYRKPVIYRSNTCRNSENAFRIPTLIQHNLIQITNGWINGLQQIIGTQRVGNMRSLGCNSLLDQIAIKFDHNSEFKRPHIAKKRMRWKSPSEWESCTLRWCKQERCRRLRFWDEERSRTWKIE